MSKPDALREEIVTAQEGEKILGYKIEPCWCCGKDVELSLAMSCVRCADSTCVGWLVWVPVIGWNRRAGQPTREG